jgi:hypothetical protein
VNGKENMVYIHGKILFSSTNEGNVAILDSMDEAGGQQVE